MEFLVLVYSSDRNHRVLVVELAWHPLQGTYPKPMGRELTPLSILSTLGISKSTRQYYSAQMSFEGDKRPRWLALERCAVRLPSDPCSKRC